jgi:endonuclease III
MSSGRSNAGRITRVWGALRREYRDEGRKSDWDTLTWLVCAVIGDGVGDGKARSAMKRLQDAFVDWNELRVTPPDEIVPILGALPQAREKAVALTGFLNRIFELTNGLSLDFLKDKPKRDARAYLERLEGVGPAAAAHAVLHALEGHAVPVDSGVHRLLSRLGVIKADTPAPAAQSALERHVSNRDAIPCTYALRRHAEEVCIAGEPKCSVCVLRRSCPTARDLAARAAAAKRGKVHTGARRRAGAAGRA